MERVTDHPLPESRDGATTIDTCADALRGAILRGQWASGARLPPERTLADQLGVHRATLRSALARLTAQGLVQPRQGSGYAVRDFRRTGGPELLRDLVALARGDELLAHCSDLLRVRRALARSVLEHLASGVPSAARKAVQARVESFCTCVEAGESFEAIADADLAVVAELLEATGSAVLQLCLNPVAQILAGAPELRRAIYADAEHSALGWRAVVAWLEHPSFASLDPLLAAIEHRDAQTLARLRRAHPRTRTTPSKSR